MIYCSHCGAENKDTAKFCKKCGASIKAKPEKVTPSKETTPEKQNNTTNDTSKKKIILITAVIIIAIIGITALLLFNNTTTHSNDTFNNKNSFNNNNVEVNVGNEKISIPSEFHMTSSDQLINTFNEATNHYINYYYAYFGDNSGNKIYIDVAEFSNGDPYTDSTLNSIYQFKGEASTVNGVHGYYIPNGKYKYCFVYAKNNKVIGISTNNPNIIEKIV